MGDVAVVDAQPPVVDPLLRGRIAFVEEAPGRLPEVLHDMDQIDDNDDLDPLIRRLGSDAVDLSKTGQTTRAASSTTLAAIHLLLAVGRDLALCVLTIHEGVSGRSARSGLDLMHSADPRPSTWRFRGLCPALRSTVLTARRTPGWTEG